MALITDDDYEVPLGLRPTQPKSYTLGEIEHLAQRYTRDFQMSVNDELGDFLQLSRFVAWLKKRERKVEG